MKINLASNWGVKCPKRKVNSIATMPYAVSTSYGKSDNLAVKLTKQFVIKPKEAEKKGSFKKRFFYLVFEGVNNNAVVYLNGQKIGEHHGGFLPFGFDVTEQIKVKKTNKLVIDIDEQTNNDYLACGSNKHSEFDNCVGMIQGVWLYIVDNVSFAVENGIDKTFVYTSKGENNNYSICADCVLDNKVGADLNNVLVRATLMDNAGNQLKVQDFHYDMDKDLSSIKVDIPVEDPVLWSVEYPYLYNLNLELVVDNGFDQIVADTREFKKGIREFAVQNGKFMLNGEEFKIKGVCHQQSYPILGMTTTLRAEYREVLKLKNAGFNTIRLVHYPASKEIYQACDALGMIVINCVPTNGSFYSSNKFKDSVAYNFATLALRDRNYTCVAMWEATVADISNKAGLTDDLVAQCVKEIKFAFEKTTAPIIVGEVDGRENPSELGFDIAYFKYDSEKNEYYLPEGIEVGLISRYGKEGYELKESELNKKMAEQAWSYQYFVNKLEDIENSVGSILGNDIEYLNNKGKNRNDMGIMDEYRLPKYSYYFYQSQFTNNNVLFVPSTQIIEIANCMPVYTTCDSVNVYVDDEFVGNFERNAQDVSAINVEEIENEYEKFIRENSKNLNNPPILLDKNLFDNNVVKIEGVKDGEVVGYQVVDKESKSRKLKIFVDYSGVALQNDGKDFVFVHVATVDEYDNIATDKNIDVTLAIKGGVIITNSKATTKDGMCSYIIKANKGVEKTMIKAYCQEDDTIKVDYAKIMIKE